MKGYKGFDKDLKCRDMQYEVGKEYTYDGKISLCNSGFHFCLYPLDCMGYYAPSDARYCEVEVPDDCVDAETSEDTKRVSSKIKIVRELTMQDMATEAAAWHLINTPTNKRHHLTGRLSSASNTGDRSSASNTGYRSSASNTGDLSSASNTGHLSSASNTGRLSSASNTGDRSSASNTGYRSSASNTGHLSSASNTGHLSSASNTGDRSSAEASGKQSIAAVYGYGCKARGAIGCWLVLTERNDNYDIVEVRGVKVDGTIIKPMVWYALVDGKVVEA